MSTLAQDLGIEQDRKAHARPADQVQRVNRLLDALIRNHGQTPVGVAVKVDELQQQVRVLREHLETMLPLIDEAKPGSAFAISGAEYLLARVKVPT